MCTKNRHTTIALLASAVLLTCGCHDGPLYALKAANPYFSLREWKADEALGVSDHVRRKELAGLASSIGSLPKNRQAYWAGHLEKIMQNDPSADMRHLAVNAAGKMTATDPTRLIQMGLDDDNAKVRMAACRALGRRKEPAAPSLLAQTAGADSNEDVRQAAIDALANHKSPVAIESLRNALRDRNPATRDLAMESLRDATGKNLGTTPQEWIDALQTPANQPGPKTRLVNAEMETAPKR